MSKKSISLCLIYGQVPGSVGKNFFLSYLVNGSNNLVSLSVLLTSKARSLPKSGAPEMFSTQVSFSLTHKLNVWLRKAYQGQTLQLIYPIRKLKERFFDNTAPGLYNMSGQNTLAYFASSPVTNKNVL